MKNIFYLDRSKVAGNKDLNTFLINILFSTKYELNKLLEYKERVDEKLSDFDFVVCFLTESIKKGYLYGGKVPFVIEKKLQNCTKEELQEVIGFINEEIKTAKNKVFLFAVRNYCIKLLIKNIN